MGQVSWRAPEELIARVRQAAAAEHTSMNEYVTRVLDVATNPDMALTEHARLRERLLRGGLLASPSSSRRRKRSTKDEVANARRAAGKGTPLSEFVSDGR